MKVTLKSKFEFLIVGIRFTFCSPFFNESLLFLLLLEMGTNGIWAFVDVKCLFRFFISISFNIMITFTNTNVKKGNPYLLLFKIVKDNEFYILEIVSLFFRVHLRLGLGPIDPDRKYCIKFV